MSPVDLGLPNSRLRYYLTAVRRKSEIFSDTPSSRTDFDATIELMENDNSPVVHNVDLKKSLVLWRVLPLSECLLPVMKGQDDTELLIPLDTLAKYITVLDIKHPESVSTNCFTSGYDLRILYGKGFDEENEDTVDVVAISMFTKRLGVAHSVCLFSPGVCRKLKIFECLVALFVKLS